MAKSILLFLALACAGCATCQRHPAACSIGGAIIIGSVAATIAAHHSDNRQGRDITARRCTIVNPTTGECPQ